MRESLLSQLLFVTVFLLSVFTHLHAVDDRNVISDSAFNEIIASYYNSSPFYSKIDPNELLKEFANKKIVRKRKLRPKKEMLTQELTPRDWQQKYEPIRSPPLLKVKKRMHLRPRQPMETLPPVPMMTTSRPLAPVPTKAIRMRNKPIPTRNVDSFSERSYDYEIDYYDRSSFGGENFDERMATPDSRSNEKKHQSKHMKEEKGDIYSELETFFPGKTPLERDPASINYNEQASTPKKEKAVKPPSKTPSRPIFTPVYGHPYAEPLSRPNPLENGLYDAVEYVNPQTGHIDIPKLNQIPTYAKQKQTTGFVPTIPTTPTSTSTTQHIPTTSSTQSTVIKTPAIKSPFVKSLQRRYPRVDDSYEFHKTPAGEDTAYLQAEHRGIQSSPYQKHPEYRELPPQRRVSPTRRRYQSTIKEKPRKEIYPLHELNKEPGFFAPPKQFSQKLFNRGPPSSYSSQNNPNYKNLNKRYPQTSKPKKVSRPRYNAYEPPKPKYPITPYPKPSHAPPRVTSSYASPPSPQYSPKQTPYRGNPPPQKTAIDSKFREFRGNSEFNGYLDNSDTTSTIYDFDRGFPLLPPPPAMIATTQNFFGFSDVPKLGAKVDYNPPELVYNQMYGGNPAQSRSSEASLDDFGVEGQRQSLQAIPSIESSSSFFSRPNSNNDAFGSVYQ